jgi:hypothetical protein
MTSADCPSGSDRVREVARQIDADIYVNIQGDEPTLTPDFFPPLLKLFDRPEVEVSTLAVPLPAEEIADPNAVKVVTALDGRALYFSRATIPFDRDGAGFAGYRKHLGIYAYRKAALERFAALLRPRRWKSWSGWSSCACWKTASRSMWPRRRGDTIGRGYGSKDLLRGRGGAESESVSVLQGVACTITARRAQTRRQRDRRNLQRRIRFFQPRL